MATYSPQNRSLLYWLNPVHLYRTIIENRTLIGQFTKRNVRAKYQGSVLGMVWAFVNPVILLVVYTFVFGVVFHSRWAEARGSGLAEFAIILFAGLIVFNVFSESVAQAPGLVVANPNLVKKVVFPLEVLPMSMVGAALFSLLVNTIVLLSANILVNGTFHLTLLYAPIVLLPVLMISLSMAWILSSLGVFFRDIQQVVTLFISVMFFLTPIFYSIKAVPPSFQKVMNLNPLSYLVESFRAVVLWGEAPEWQSLILYYILGYLMLSIGYAFFMRTKRSFADVI